MTRMVLVVGIFWGLLAHSYAHMARSKDFSHLPPEPPFSEAKSFSEVSVSLGTPALFNFGIAHWFKGIPLVTRLSGFHAYRFFGFQADVGYITQRNGNFKQFVAASIGKFGVLPRPDDAFYDQFTFVGPTYGFNWDGLIVLCGINRTLERRASGKKSELVMPHLQVGWAFNIK